MKFEGKKCKYCQHHNCVKSNKCKVCNTTLGRGSSGKPVGVRPKKGALSFLENLGLPSEWDTSAVNLHEDLFSKCESRIKQQRTFDHKSLGVGVCYRCGHVLWTTVDGAHTFLVDKPNNMSKEDAPASAYLRAVRNCSLSFEYSERGTSTKERWYCCSHCKSAIIPTDQHVGHVFGKDVSDVLPMFLSGR